MNDDLYNQAKQALLDHIQEIFDEMEAEMAMLHQEKFILLEDVLDDATDHGELKVAFLQWYNEHGDDIEFEQDVHDLWKQAMVRMDE